MKAALKGCEGCAGVGVHQVARQAAAVAIILHRFGRRAGEGSCGLYD